MLRSYIQAAALVLICLLPATSVIAQGHDFYVKTGQGEELTVKHRSFGRKDVEIKDRFGDRYVHTEGLFGRGETDINVLGNRFNKKARLLSGPEIEASSILGDTIVSKKGPSGKRTTTVDLSGIGALLNQFISSMKQPAVQPVDPGFASDPFARMNSQSEPNSALPTDKRVITPVFPYGQHTNSPQHSSNNFSNDSVLKAPFSAQPNFYGDYDKSGVISRPIQPDWASESKGVPTLGDKLGPADK